MARDFFNGQVRILTNSDSIFVFGFRMDMTVFIPGGESVTSFCGLLNCSDIILGSILRFATFFNCASISLAKLYRVK